MPTKKLTLVRLPLVYNANLDVMATKEKYRRFEIFSIGGFLPKYFSL